MAKERILKEATFSTNAPVYLVMPLGIVLCITIIGIPLALILVPILLIYYQAYYKSLRVILTSRDLKVHLGIFNTEEKSIPLEKITDLAVYQGPIMRHFGLKGIRVETAGQSTGLGALVSVVGINETDAFRDLVLAQRDRITDRDESDAGPSNASPSASTVSAGHGQAELIATLVEIRDSLQRIEHQLREHK